MGPFEPSIRGPMIMTGDLSMSDLIHPRPPTKAILSAQYMIGISIGVGYVGITLVELREDVLSDTVFVLVLAALAAFFIEIVVIFGLVPPKEELLACAPGGCAGMTGLPVVACDHLGCVIVHHLLRMFFFIPCAPLASKILFSLSKK